MSVNRNNVVEDLTLQLLELLSIEDYLQEAVEEQSRKLARARSDNSKRRLKKAIPTLQLGLLDVRRKILVVENNLSVIQGEHDD